MKYEKHETRRIKKRIEELKILKETEILNNIITKEEVEKIIESYESWINYLERNWE